MGRVACFSLSTGEVSVLLCTFGGLDMAAGALLCSLTPKPGVLAGTFNLQCIIAKGQNHLTSSKAGERALFVLCCLMAGWLLPCTYCCLQENPRLL